MRRARGGPKPGARRAHSPPASHRYVSRNGDSPLWQVAETTPGVLYEYVPPRRGKDRFAWVSTLAREVLELEPEELERDSGLLWRMVPPADFARVAATVQEAVVRRGELEAEFPIDTPSGRRKWVRARSRPTPSSGRRVPHWCGILLDVSREHELLDALNHDRARLLQMSEAMPDLVLRLDREGRISYANPAVVADSGLALEEIVGKDLADLGMSAASLSTWRAAVERAFRGDVARCETQGRGREWEVLMVPERRAAGAVESILCIGRDVTERNRALEELRESDRRKSDFLALLSHELRNPLAPIRNAIYLLGRVPPGSEQAHRAHAVVERQVGQLARLVDDLLDVTRIARNRMLLDRQRLELNELVLRTVEDHRSTFEAAGIELTVEPAPEALYLDGDPARLAQVVANLLHNAAKFTPVGGAVSIRLSRRAPDLARLVVKDTGIGMGLEVLSRIFQPFRQEDDGRSRGGLGLGLALVKGLVASHGGEVEARSEGPGHGSEFEVRLPLLASEEAADREGPRPGNSHRRVLIIEDNVDSATTLRDVLEMEGHEVEVAYDGTEGLARAREFHPAVVLCDLGLPGMDGFEVARTLRATPELAGVHLIAVSGYALPEDVRRAKDAGFERHLPKPASLEQLEQALEEMG